MTRVKANHRADDSQRCWEVVDSQLRFGGTRRMSDTDTCICTFSHKLTPTYIRYFLDLCIKKIRIPDLK